MESMNEKYKSSESSPIDAAEGVATNESIQVLDLYQTAEKIYTRRLEGFYRTLRSWAWIPMLLTFFVIPWINIDGRQAMWFDLGERKFHIFWLTFWPQDFPLLAWLLIIAAFGLFTVTNFLGRVWCGFSCPQTVYTQIFINIEEFFEGNRNQRIKLDKQPWTYNKLWRKSGKQLTWWLIALATGLTFVGYFNPIREFLPGFFTLDAHPAAIFWAVVFTALTWANAGMMREQICLYVCPYARFQSAMFDSDTLIVSYDETRGEQRGSRKRNQDPKESGLGDCVDCNLCVQVCPTGIDIRDGLQYECISCGLCIDACNAVMDKMEYPRGLIDFSTENILKSGDKFRLFRPRLVGYFAVLLVMCSLFVYTILTRIPLEVDIIRDRDLLYRTTAEGLIENSYTLKINNMDRRDHVYQLDLDSEHDLSFIGQREVSVPQGEIVELLVRLRLPQGELKAPNSQIHFVVQSLDSPGIVDREESRFLGPLPKR